MSDSVDDDDFLFLPDEENVKLTPKIEPEKSKTKKNIELGEDAILINENKMKIENIKKEFPIFNNKVQNNDLVYLDSANSSQKPLVVVDAEHFIELVSCQNKK